MAHGFGKMHYRTGIVHEGMFLYGKNSFPTRLQCSDSYIKSSYFYKYNTYIQFDYIGNLIVHPITSGNPDERLVITADGYRYKGHLDHHHQKHG